MEIVKGKVTIITKGKENNIDDRNIVDHTHNNDANSNFYSKKDHNNRKLMMVFFFYSLVLHPPRKLCVLVELVRSLVNSRITQGLYEFFL